MGVGTWGTTTLADGRTAGALALPAVERPVLQRVIDVVNRVRAAKLSGVLPVVDLVSHAQRVWLVTATPAAPTVASLIGRLTPALAATIAGDTARTLLDLHDAGLSHGALDASVVVVGPEGTVLVNEVGLAAAVRGEVPDAAADVAAWSAMVRDLVPSDPMLNAVATAAAAGLETALQVLEANTGSWPGYGDRAALLALPTAVPAPRPPAEPVPAGSTTLLGEPAPAGPSSEAATRLGQRRVVASPAPAASVGPAASTRERGPVSLRFGPGVPAHLPVRSPVRPAAPPRRRGRRIATVLTTVVTLVLAAGTGYVLWDRYAHPLTLTAVSVAATSLAECDAKADVVATVQTNGRRGTFAYQWTLHLDGRATDEVTARMEQSVDAGQTSVDTHLLWSFSGKGEAKGTATMTILSPSALESTGPIAYSCR
jgi:hypothetical protein